MTNYKPSHDSLSIGGHVVALPPGAYRKDLFQNDARSTVGVSFHLPSSTGIVNYQVATGRKFHCVGVKLETLGTSRTCTIYQSDDVDGSTNPVNIAIWSSPGFSYKYEFFLPFATGFTTVAAEKYINIKVNVTAASYGHIQLIGYETLE